MRNNSLNVAFKKNDYVSLFIERRRITANTQLNGEPKRFLLNVLLLTHERWNKFYIESKNKQQE